MADLVVGADGRARPTWADVDDLHRDYYDNEWGNEIRDERGLFERLSLEAFQSGLSWAVILRKRDRFREVFASFDPEVVAEFDEAKVEELLSDAGIVRNRSKIEATINNAKQVIVLRSKGGLAELIWSAEPAEQPRPTTFAEVGLRPEAVELAKKLKKAGFKFVGPTTVQAMLEAAGVINHHFVGSHRRPE